MLFRERLSCMKSTHTSAHGYEAKRTILVLLMGATAQAVMVVSSLTLILGLYKL